MATHNELGVLGEDIATRYLLQKGYKLLDRNWRWKKKELDIIAIDKEFLVFVEVKTRKFGSLENPKDAVTRKKQKFIIEGANAYIESKNLENEVRLDIISVIIKDEDHIIEHIEDAFYPIVK
ncbi:MAG: YraN family protein [Bacteroidota bacterium]